MITIEKLSEAVKLLKKGKLVVFPTETVYALAGDASNLAAVQQIFMLKERPIHQPLSVLLAKEHDVQQWAYDIPPIAEKLVERFWPGPLTLIFYKKKSVLSVLTGGQNKIGLRVPDHPVAQAILTAFGSGLAAPSANRSSHMSPTQIEHVCQEFDNKLDLIIDGGPCAIGIESTIIDVTFAIPRILRLGAISLEEIRSITAYKVEESIVQPSKKPLLKQVSKQELESIIDSYLKQDKTLTVFGLETIKKKNKNLTWISMPNDARQYGQVLYKYLHEAEQHASNHILVESVPSLKAWSGVQAILDKYSA